MSATMRAGGTLGGTVAFVACAFCLVGAASCTAILGISDPVDEGADTGTTDSTPSEAGDSVTTTLPDTTPVDTTPVETSVDCGAAADGTECGAAPRAICLHGTCQVSRCGDGFVDGVRKEECDDGNGVNGDGCDTDCAYSCNSTLAPSKTCGTSYCAPKTCSGHACVGAASPCGAPSVSCKKVSCDEGSRSCPETLIDGDGDGHGPASSPVASPCDDCDDANANAFPGQTKFFTSPRAGGSFDYDCDGAETPESTATGSCDLDPVSGACNFAAGWDGSVPACGAAGDVLVSCLFRSTSSTCDPSIVSKTQGCR